MPTIPRTALLAALCALGLPPAFAQAAATAPSEALPGYRSAFDGYRPFGQEDVQPWRQTNDTVREAGGWRAYARETSGAPSPAQPTEQRPAAAGLANPGNQAQPADPHAGHHKP